LPETALRIGLFYPAGLPDSSRIYIDALAPELTKAGCALVPFAGPVLPAGVDLYWQPSAGRNGPSEIFKNAAAPLVVTFHGAANLALPLRDCYGPGWRQQLKGYFARRETRLGWRRGAGLISAVIAVSEYAKKEAERYLGLPEKLITAIYHGVDHQLFRPVDNTAGRGRCLLHVSAYQPKKNLERLIAAYERLPAGERPPLKIVALGYRPGQVPAGVEIVSQPLGRSEVAGLYQNALALVFPSLHETFGLPIVEAMACGCPVITANNTACAEVAGAAALLIDPRSINEIAGAMKNIAADRPLRLALRAKGLERAAQFAWQKSAGEHAALFRLRAGR